jgi:hypothetical protein
MLARQGKKLLDEQMPARRNNVQRSKERVQIDARPLPIYVISNGIVCTTSLVLLLDDFSDYPIRYALVPRKVLDAQKLPKRTDFTAQDVGILIASAMYHENARFEVIYNDNGSQLVAMEELLRNLSEENEPLTRMAKSIPGRPRGRGKIEGFLGRLDIFLKELPGFVIDEKDRAHIKLAQTATNMRTIEQFRQYLDSFFEQLRNEPPTKRQTRTRRELWEMNGALPAPPIRHLMSLVPERESRYVKLNHWKFDFLGEEYEPQTTNEEDLMRWALAAQQPEYRPLRAAKLDTGWKVEVCLSDDTWCECVVKGQQKVSTETQAKLQAGVLKQIKQRHTAMLATAHEQIKSSQADTLLKDLVTRKPIFPAEKQIYTSNDTTAVSGNPAMLNEPLKKTGSEDAPIASLSTKKRQRREQTMIAKNQQTQPQGAADKSPNPEPANSTPAYPKEDKNALIRRWKDDQAEW